MRITPKLAAAGLAGALSVTGLAAVVAAPLASAATSEDDGTTADDGASLGDRLQRITDALAGLVSDGTITQEQADAVADTLDRSDALRGPGHGPGGHLDLDVAAEALGLTVDQLRTALSAEGATLADVAATQGVDTGSLVDALVASRTDELTQAVTDGRLTQEEADARISELPDRVAAAVEQAGGFGGHGHGHGGGRHGGPRGGAAPGTTDEGTTEDGTTDDGSSTTEPSAYDA